MIFPGVRLLGIGLIVKTVANTVIFLLKSAYGLLRYLRMRIFALYVIGASVYALAADVKKGSATSQTLLIVGALLFLISLFLFAKALSDEEKKKQKERKEKRKKKEDPAPAPTTVTLQTADGQSVPIVIAPSAQIPAQAPPAYQPMPSSLAFEENTESYLKDPKSEVPRYFRVAQNPKYVMAEYSDRVELFYDSPRGLKYVRTDYK